MAIQVLFRFECIIIFLHTDSCLNVECDIPGEKCFYGKCKCGGTESSCTSHAINSTSGWRHYVQGNVFCDAVDSTCKCKNTVLDVVTTCSAENKFCTKEGCKCSTSLDEYDYDIDDKSQGTCTIGSDRCYNTGPDSHLLCDGKQNIQYILYNNNGFIYRYVDKDRNLSYKPSFSLKDHVMKAKKVIIH